MHAPPLSDFSSLSLFELDELAEGRAESIIRPTDSDEEEDGAMQVDDGAAGGGGGGGGGAEDPEVREEWSCVTSGVCDIRVV